MTERFYLFSEWAWIHYTSDAEDGVGAPLGVAGEDLLNLGSSNVVGENLVTQMVGMKYKPNGHFGFLGHFNG